MTLQELEEKCKELLRVGADPNTPVMTWHINFLLTDVVQFEYVIDIDNKAVVVIA